MSSLFLLDRISERRRCPSRTVRLILECLEDRSVPALGLFIENFQSDLNPTQPGWDSWDADPATLPPGPDELHIRNDFPHYPLTNGPTARGGYLAIEERVLLSDPAPYGPYVMSLFSSELTGEGRIVFAFPPVGSPGGILTGEEIAAVGVDVRGLGLITFEGTHGELTVGVSSPLGLNGQFVWEHVSVTRNTMAGHEELGGIRRIIFRAGPRLEVNRLSTLVLDAETPPPTVLIANDDSGTVSQSQLLPRVAIDWRQNDLHVDAQEFHLVDYTQPLHGTLTMDEQWAVYVPDPEFLGRDSFSYTIADGQGHHDTADVIIDVTTNVAPVAQEFETYIERRNQLGQFTGTIATDLDNNQLSGELLRAPRHGSVTFSTQHVPGGVGTLQFTYTPFAETIRFNDSFAFRVTDPSEESDDGTVTIMTDNTFASTANDDSFAVPSDIVLPIDFDRGGVLENDAAAVEPYDITQRDQLFAEVVDGPFFGRLTRFLSDGTFSYLPNPGFEGIDFFTYRLGDGDLTGAVATAQLYVYPDVPTAFGDQFIVTRPQDFIRLEPLGPYYSFDAPGFVANDQVYVGWQGDWHLETFDDSVFLGDDGGWTFFARPDFVGFRRFTYRYSRWPLVTRWATIDVRVDPPTGTTFGTLPLRDGGNLFLASAAGHVLMNAAIVNVENPPPGYAFPFGMVTFDIAGLTSGEATTVTMIVPDQYPEPTSYFKFGPTPDDPRTPEDERQPHWYEFQFDGTTGAVINGREIVLHFVDGQRGDDDLTANGEIQDPGGPAVSLQPQVERIVLGNGQEQRSRFFHVQVYFSDLITLDRNAFELYLGRKRFPIHSIMTSEVDGKTVATLRFAARLLPNQSLPEGQYRVVTKAASVHGRSRMAMQLDHTDTFFRRFGDVNGDGMVNAADQAVFDGAFGRRAGQAGYLWYLDFNGDGRIDKTDRSAFLARKQRPR